MRTVLITLLAACSSYEVHLVDSGGSNDARTCVGSAFDPCTTNDQCGSMNCHLYSGAGLQVCTQACTPGDNTTCPVDATGANGICNTMGNCKPAKANACVP
ncbi:MAG: hypothetical protein ABI467_27270 [Kofleriaceae bacterium]